MRTRFDQLAKQVLKAALSRIGTAETEREVAGEVQAIDVWFVPTPGLEAEREALGLLGKMANRACAFEAFHEAPDGEEIRACLGKHFAWRTRLRTAEPDLAAPGLWILTAGRPTTVIDEFALTSNPATPGLYTAPAGYGFEVVVIAELPASRDTLFVRLLGAGKTLQQALRELSALPAAALEHRLAVPIVVRLRFEIARSARQTKEEEQLMDAMGQTFEEFVEEKLQQGRQEGRQEGQHEGRREERREGVKRLFAWRLERPLHDDEVRAINERISRLGAERLEEVVLDRALNLTVWLADPNAR